MFQSTPPHGGRPIWPSWLTLDMSFNPRPRMGATGLIGVKRLILPVSIHAPAWGATNDFPEVKAFLQVSIHAPAWGATIALQLINFKRSIVGFLRTVFFLPIRYLIVKEQFL